MTKSLLNKTENGLDQNKKTSRGKRSLGFVIGRAFWIDFTFSIYNEFYKCN